MKNPTRSLRRTLERTKPGVAAVARRLRDIVAVVGEALNSHRERHPTIAEIVAMMVHHLIAAVIERATIWLLRNVAGRSRFRPSGSQVLPFPALRPVP